MYLYFIDSFTHSRYLPYRVFLLDLDFVSEFIWVICHMSVLICELQISYSDGDTTRSEQGYWQ